MIPKILIALLALPGFLALAMAFQPPDDKERLKAIGPTDSLPSMLRRALDPGKDFLPIKKPGPNDWLANHSEPGQTFEQYKGSGFLRPDTNRSKLVVQPMGDFGKGVAPSLESLRECAAAFFIMPVESLPPWPITGKGFTSRINAYTQKRQLLTTDLLLLLKHDLPKDAFAAIGVTMEDLYPDPAWNFVFGQATFSERVGVFSFARYDPGFFGETKTKADRLLMLRRSCKVLTHEVGHMFGIAHCTFFECGMNGSNHMDESDARPIHLCPVCLRKLQFNIGFDVEKRYAKLEKFYRAAGMIAEADWIAKRLVHIRKPR